MLWVTISKKWHQPTIYTNVTREDGIEMSVPVADFVEAMRREIGSVTFTMTEAQFRAKIEAARDAVIEGIKEESVKCVGVGP